jgi:meso-butanediol dehydrogenase/(S,S)-butanediol dehydrogenase/diacetyl reductase
VSGLGGLDIVVVCAAVRAYYTLAEAPAESWERILAVNLLGTQNLLKAALPSLRKKSGSSVVIVSSVFAGVGRRGMGQYDATKAALISLTRTLAVEESDYGIRVNAVCPGSVWTPYTVSRAEARGMTEKELRDKGAIRALLNRWAEPEEIAYPILWLASEEASFITGTSLTVDGGYSVT